MTFFLSSVPAIFRNKHIARKQIENWLRLYRNVHTGSDEYVDEILCVRRANKTRSFRRAVVSLLFFFVLGWCYVCVCVCVLCVCVCVCPVMPHLTFNLRKHGASCQRSSSTWRTLSGSPWCWTAPPWASTGWRREPSSTTPTSTPPCPTSSPQPRSASDTRRLNRLSRSDILFLGQSLVKAGGIYDVLSNTKYTDSRDENNSCIVLLEQSHINTGSRNVVASTTLIRLSVWAKRVPTASSSSTRVHSFCSMLPLDRMVVRHCYVSPILKQKPMANAVSSYCASKYGILSILTSVTFVLTSVSFVPPMPSKVH